jgi:hypothetical protein
MFSQIMAHEIPKTARLTLQDFLEARYENSLSKYLSLSVKYLDRDIHISITTTDNEPSTYSTHIPTTVAFDQSALIFELQPKNQPG